MRAEPEQAVIVHVVFADTVGYTRLSMEEKREFDSVLSDIVRRAIRDDPDVVRIDNGDGFALGFFGEPTVAAEAVVEIHLALQAATSLKMRLGVHSGPAYRRTDIAGKPNLTGPGVEKAQRVMTLADGDEILVSDYFAENLRAFAGWADRLTPLGERIVKHGEIIRVCRLDPAHAGTHVRQSALGRQREPGSGTESPTDGEPPTGEVAAVAMAVASGPPLGNLPLSVTSFVGREKEVDEVIGRFEGARLVTLTGSGGCGKTRLALQVAERISRSGFAAWLVELDALGPQALVHRTVAACLGIKEKPGQPLDETVAGHLAERELLLVLDNCEHLLESVVKFATTVLRDCPGVKLLATSRQALGVQGETTFRVPSLTLPSPGDERTASGLIHYEAVRLFVERARLHQPCFEVTSGNASAVATVCRRLDGIPLAIELAAARVRSLTIEDINDRLDQRFRLLTGGSRNVLPRQQTLRSLFDWSYDLLDEAERALFGRVSVFAGGFFLQDAEKVATGGIVDESEVMDLLSSLADKSLLIVDTTGRNARYRLLESIRQYARNRMAEVEDVDTWRRRHLERYLALAEEAEPHLMGPEQRQWRARLEAEHDNFRTAIDWGIEEPNAKDEVLRLAGALWRFWDVRGHLSEGRSRLEAASRAGADGDRRALGKVLHGAGTIAFGQADFAEAQALLERALTIRREVGDPVPIAGTINNLGNIAWAQGDLETARTRLEESLAISREAGAVAGIAGSLLNLGNLALDRGDFLGAGEKYEESLRLRRSLNDPGGVATCLNNLGNVSVRLGEPERARDLLLESLAIERELGEPRGIAETLLHLGTLYLEQGEVAVARGHFEESLALQRDLGARLGIASAMFMLGELAADSGAPLHAARLWGASDRLRAEIGSPVAPSDQARHDRRVEHARLAAGTEDFAAAYSAGEATDLGQAVEIALEA